MTTPSTTVEGWSGFPPADMPRIIFDSLPDPRLRLSGLGATLREPRPWPLTERLWQASGVRVASQPRRKGLRKAAARHHRQGRAVVRSVAPASSICCSGVGRYWNHVSCVSRRMCLAGGSLQGGAFCTETCTETPAGCWLPKNGLFLNHGRERDCRLPIHLPALSL
jgi:hypothetical protein